MFVSDVGKVKPYFLSAGEVVDKSTSQKYINYGPAPSTTT